MRNWLAIFAVIAWPLCVVAAPDEETAKGSKVEYTLHNGHFEKNNSGLKGDSSYLVFTNREAFDKIFGVAATMRKQNFVPKDAFDKNLVVAVIKRGKAVTEYKVEQVTADDGTLYVQYTAKMGDPGSATFASPLILSVDKDKYKSVVFIENGKKAETVKIEKKE
jgi:hypothetical protein